MLDIQSIRENPDQVKTGVKNKGLDPKLVDELLKLDSKRRQLISEVEKLRAERNAAAKIKDIPAGKKIKLELQKLEPELKTVEAEFQIALTGLPNLPAKDVPIGKSEADNKVIKEDKPEKFSFAPKDHLELGETLDIIDFTRGAKVAGSSFYYLKNDGALLELALVAFGLNFLQKKGFTPMITPDLSKSRYYLGTGYLPKGPEAQIYEIKDNDLGLIATAEVTLAGYHADEILAAETLPKKYAGYSHCFRVEAGGYGKYAKGLYRVHQFTKVEMFSHCLPEQSTKIHQELLALEEEFWQSLKIPYRVIEMCTADLGAQAVKKYDLEAWLPGRNDWGEITSTSNTTDYQARRLNIKYKKGAQSGYAHTLNGTLVATSRAIIAIVENYQAIDGSVKVPEVLQPYLGKKVIASKGGQE